MTADLQVGDLVRVRRQVLDGNPRTPSYLRGWVGEVIERHGVVSNPIDHREAYPPLYSVLFRGIAGDPEQEVVADLHADWLEEV